VSSMVRSDEATSKDGASAFGGSTMVQRPPSATGVRETGPMRADAGDTTSGARGAGGELTAV
jgi:hypothetical protein